MKWSGGKPKQHKKRTELWYFKWITIVSLTSCWRCRSCKSKLFRQNAFIRFSCWCDFSLIEQKMESVVKFLDKNFQYKILCSTDFWKYNTLMRDYWFVSLALQTKDSSSAIIHTTNHIKSFLFFNFPFFLFFKMFFNWNK